MTPPATPLHQLFDLARRHRPHGVTVPAALYNAARGQLIALRDIAESGAHPASRVAERARRCLSVTDSAHLTSDACHELAMQSQHVLREAGMMMHEGAK